MYKDENQVHLSWETINQADTNRHKLMTDQNLIKYVKTKVSPH